MAYIQREIVEGAAEKMGLRIVSNMEQAVMKGDYTFVFVLAFMIAGMADLNVFASIPLVGWIFDAITVLVLWGLLSTFNNFIVTKVKVLRAVLYFLEFIPAVDALPFWTAAVALTWYRVRQAAKDGRAGLEQIHNTGNVDTDKLKQFS